VIIIELPENQSTGPQVGGMYTDRHRLVIPQSVLPYNVIKSGLCLPQRAGASFCTMTNLQIKLTARSEGKFNAFSEEQTALT
jgi:hypothetical protein